jgi:putative ABC transport system ATP-binding protein
VLLLDEHLAALDPGTQATVMKLTVELVEQLGCTALMVTHNMAHALQLGDRLLVMSRGRVIADLDRQTKAGFTVSELVNTLSDAGDVLSDRVLLA